MSSAPPYDERSGEDLYRAQVLREPPPRISVVVGEIVHDLRSALDHLAWQLTLPAKRTNHTGFPICSVQCAAASSWTRARNCARVIARIAVPDCS
jgi:hypothetical protein